MTGAPPAAAAAVVLNGALGACRPPRRIMWEVGAAAAHNNAMTSFLDFAHHRPAGAGARRLGGAALVSKCRASLQPGRFNGAFTPCIPVLCRSMPSIIPVTGGCIVIS
jgi:hypothetical protein